MIGFDGMRRNNIKKEVKKLSRSYFETKVVKVKKTKNNLQNIMCNNCSLPIKEQDKCVFINCPKIKPKGNWVKL